MPRARRNKVISLTKTAKKTRADKESMLDKVREAAQQYSFVWLFSIGNMRNSCLKEVRQLWEGSRLFYGKLGVLRKALGTAEEDEVRTGLSNISNRLAGPVGLLFTDSLPKEVQDWFASYSRKDFARAGNVATETIELPEGPVMIRSNPPEAMPHSIEPQLRQLGMPTELRRGVPTLLRNFTVSKKGKKISKEAAQILKHLLIMQAEFRIIPLAYWSAVEAEKGGKKAVTEMKLSAEERKLIEQSQAPGSGTVGQVTKPKSKDKTRAKKAPKAAGADAEDEEDEEMGEEDEEDEDDDEEEEDTEFAAGDKVTDDMMLPAHLQ